MNIINVQTDRLSKIETCVTNQNTISKEYSISNCTHVLIGNRIMISLKTQLPTTICEFYAFGYDLSSETVGMQCNLP